MALEIEQKFIYSYLPYEELRFKYKSVVTRKYLSTEPLVCINERLLQNGKKKYYLTLKEEGLLIRKECTSMVTEEIFNDIFNFVESAPLVIETYEFDLDDTHYISFKKIRDLDVKFAEIEFKDKEDYEKISPIIARMPFFAGDVTYDESYYVKNIWKRINDVE